MPALTAEINRMQGSQVEIQLGRGDAPITVTLCPQETQETVSTSNGSYRQLLALGEVDQPEVNNSQPEVNTPLTGFYEGQTVEQLEYIQQQPLFYPNQQEFTPQEFSQQPDTNVNQQHDQQPMLNPVLDTTELTTEEDFSAPASPIIGDTPESTRTPGRDGKGRFLRKSGGTPKQNQIREKDRERKRLNKPLNTFRKMAEVSMEEEEFEYFSVFKTKDGDVFYSGSNEFVKNFKDNKPIIEYNESMIESRRDSLVQKLLVQKAKKTAVRPSPNKKGMPSQLSFLPGLSSCASISSAQRQSLENTLPLVEEEDTVALNATSIESLSKRTFTRQKRKPASARAEVMESSLGIEPTPGKKGKRGRGRVGRGKNND